MAEKAVCKRISLTLASVFLCSLAFSQNFSTNEKLLKNMIDKKANKSDTATYVMPWELGAYQLGPDKRVEYVGGVIRPSAGVWGFISDTEHTYFPSNSSISQDNVTNYSVRVSYGFTAKRVISFLAVTDDALAKGWQVGSSVGQSYADIVLYKNIVIGARVYFNGTAFTYANATEACSFAYDTTSGALTITHPNVNTGAASTMPQATSMTATYRPIITSTTDNTTVIKFVKTDGSIYTGAANTNMAFYFERNGGWILMNPSNTNFPTSGNIWYFGVFER